MKIIAAPAFKNRPSNPYNWLLYSNMKAEVSEFSYSVAPHGSYSILHFHWPERELNTPRHSVIILARLWFKLLVIRRWRARGTRVVWTAHNLKSHERTSPRLERWFWRKFTSLLDGVIALSGHGLEAARRVHPALASLPGFVVPHGHYRGEYPNNSAPNARQALGIEPETKVFLFFGKIRYYKNVPSLMAAFNQLTGEDAVLYIVGQPCEAHIESQVKALAGSDPRIRLHLGHVSPDVVQSYFNAADLVVLPFREIVNSGSALLALSFDRPVLVPMKGAMSELAAAVGEDWVRTYSGELTAENLRQSMDWAQTTPRPFEAPLDAFAWPAISAQTIEAFQQIAAIDSHAHRVDAQQRLAPLNKSALHNVGRNQ